MRRLFSLLFFRKVVGIERFTLKPRFLPIRMDAPGGVRWISSDGGWSNGAKIKTQTIPRASNKTSENPTLGWVLDPDDLKWKNMGLWTVYLGKMRQRVDRRQPFFLHLSWLGNGSKKEDTKMLNRRVKLKTLMIMPQTFFCRVQLSDFLSQWDLVCDRKHLKAMTQSVYMGGLLVGSVAFSTLSDHFGRKVAVFLSILIMVSIERIVFEMWLFEYCVPWIPGTDASKQLTLILFDVRSWWTKFKAMRVVWRKSKYPSLRRNKINIGWSLNIVCPQYKVTQKIHAWFSVWQAPSLVG